MSPREEFPSSTGKGKVDFPDAEIPSPDIRASRITKILFAKVALASTQVCFSQGISYLQC